MGLQSKEYRHYRQALAVSAVAALLLALLQAGVGKTTLFTAINGWWSVPADYFFFCVTYLGDGIVWVPLFLWLIFFQRRYLAAAITAVLVCTAITHLFKRVILIDAARPLKALPDIVRAVPLMDGKNAFIHSFPSGHTSTAFTVALLLCLIVHKRWAVVLFLVLALLAGYSRVYLAQHFLADVAGGVVVGMLSSYCAYAAHKSYHRRNRLPRSGATG